MDIITPIILVASLGGTAYFVKKRFDKIDILCKKVSRLEQAIFLIPCVKSVFEKEL